MPHASGSGLELRLMFGFQLGSVLRLLFRLRLILLRILSRN